MSALLLAGVLGCSSGGDVSLLEEELRQKEDMIADLDAQVVKMRQELAASQVEMNSLREQMAGTDAGLVAEQAATLAKAEKITFHRLLTSGLNQDDLPGDERLSVLITPLDAEGELIKLPSRIELSLYDHSLPEAQQKIGHWAFSTDEAKDAWHKGFTASGFLFELPWQTPPKSGKLTLHGRLTAPDGRQFDTTSQVAVRLPNAVNTADAHRPLAQPITQTVGTAGKVLPDIERDLPVLEGVQTSDRFTLDEIPVQR
jgi:hypothetical protein